MTHHGGGHGGHRGHGGGGYRGGSGAYGLYGAYPYPYPYYDDSYDDGGFGADADLKTLLAGSLALMQRLGPNGKATIADAQAFNPNATQADVDAVNVMSPADRTAQIASLKAMLGPGPAQGQPLVTTNPSPSHLVTKFDYHGAPIFRHRVGQPWDWSGTLGFAAGAITAVMIWGGVWPAAFLGGVGAAIGHNIAKARARVPGDKPR